MNKTEALHELKLMEDKLVQLLDLEKQTYRQGKDLYELGKDIKSLNKEILEVHKDILENMHNDIVELSVKQSLICNLRCNVLMLPDNVDIDIDGYNIIINNVVSVDDVNKIINKVNNKVGGDYNYDPKEVLESIIDKSNDAEDDMSELDVNIAKLFGIDYKSAYKMRKNSHTSNIINEILDL